MIHHYQHKLLRVGNLVEWKGNDAPDWILSKIDISDLEAIANGEGGKYARVQISNELMERFGFKVDRYKNDWQRSFTQYTKGKVNTFRVDGYSLSFVVNRFDDNPDFYYWCNNNVRVPLRFADELQNLYLMMAKEEIDIELKSWT